MATCNPATLLEAAKCFKCRSKKELQAIIAQLLCNVSNGEMTWTAATSQVWAASGAPTHTPTVIAQVYFDTDTGVQYNWYSSAWH